MNNPLELVVTKSVVGELETNIAQLEKYVDAKLEEYKPELYAGDAAAAKKDRAELNSSRKFLADKRIAVMKELMKPYSDFEARCKAPEKKIDFASGQLDEIVKSREQKEKDEKRAMVADIWKLKNFGLVSLDKVFNPKWLNKSKKITEISEEMDAIIERIYSDLKTIEKYADDKETLKAHYLISLSISDTLDYGEELQKKRELAQKEASGRSEREHGEQIKRQEREVAREEKNLSRSSSRSLAAGALEIEAQKPEAKEYVVSIRATEEQLLRLKSACNSIGIEYSVEELVF